jgi:hypothetical protein
MQIKVYVCFLIFLSFNSLFAQNEEDKSRLSDNFKHNVKNIDDFIDRFKKSINKAIAKIGQPSFRKSTEKKEKILSEREKQRKERRQALIDGNIEKVKDFTDDVSLYTTGIKVQPPEGYYFILVGRSSISKSEYSVLFSKSIIFKSFTNCFI